MLKTVEYSVEGEEEEAGGGGEKCIMGLNFN